MTKCPFCEKPINENTAQCPHCGAPITSTISNTNVKTERPSAGICPNCKSPVNKSDIICIYCGTNLLTGTKIVTETPKGKSSILPKFQKKYFLYGFIIILLLVAIGVGIVFLTYDPVSSAINLSRTNLLGAIDVLQKYTAKNPRNIHAHLVLGKLYIKNNQLDEAMVELEKVLSANEKDNDVLWLALYVSTKKKDKVNQIKYIKLLQQRYPEKKILNLLSILGEGNVSDINLIKQDLSSLPNSDPIKDGIISLLLSKNSYNEALNLLNDEDVSGRTSLLLLILSEYMKDEQNTKKYLDLLKGNTQELSDTEKAYIACLLLKNGDTNGSLQVLQSLKAKDKLPVAISYLYGLSLLNAGLTTEAIIELDKVKNSESNLSIEAILDLALIYFQQDNITKATELIQNIKNKGQQTPRSYLIEGRIALTNNDINYAQQCFANAIQKDPNYAPAYLENGLLYIQRGILQEGLKNLKTYIQIVKNTVPSYSTAEIEVLIEQIEQTLVDSPKTVTDITTQ